MTDIQEEESQVKIVCEWCGEKFNRHSMKGPKPRYCKPSCRQRDFERRKMANAIYIPDDLLDELYAEARKRGISVPDLMLLAVRGALDAEKA